MTPANNVYALQDKRHQALTRAAQLLAQMSTAGQICPVEALDIIRTLTNIPERNL